MRWFITRRLQPLRLWRRRQGQRVPLMLQSPLLSRQGHRQARLRLQGQGLPQAPQGHRRQPLEAFLLQPRPHLRALPVRV